jgi:hypothetical protein
LSSASYGAGRGSDQGRQHGYLVDSFDTEAMAGDLRCAQDPAAGAAVPRAGAPWSRSTTRSGSICRRISRDRAACRIEPTLVAVLRAARRADGLVGAR